MSRRKRRAERRRRPRIRVGRFGLPRSYATKGMDHISAGRLRNIGPTANESGSLEKFAAVLVHNGEDITRFDNAHEVPHSNA
jgi:hypothetical protein